MANLVSTVVRSQLPTSMRPPRVLTRSFPLIPAIITVCDSVQLLGFGLFGSLTLTFGLYGFCSSGQSFASGFLQIPPHGGHPCLWLTLPAAGRARDFHPIERALAGRTKKKTGIPVRRNPGLLFYSVFCFINSLLFLPEQRDQSQSSGISSSSPSSM